MGWSDHNEAYNTPEYRRARKECLAAATRCALAIEGVCTGKPTQADHIDGLKNDPQHRRLQAVCAPCHDVKTAAERRAALAASRAEAGLFRRLGKKRPPKPAPRTKW